jgi:uridine kinase
VKKPKQPFLVAIVGGSGSGKSWLADKLQSALGHNAGRLSLDDFYRDRSHLSPVQRDRINFDNPAAINWPEFEHVLNSCHHWRKTRVPRYDFKTHCRLPRSRVLKPKPIMLVEGLWLLRSPRIRKLFGFRIFLDSPTQLRLRRRLARDIADRGRSRSSIQEQFRKTVEPMHRKYVAPQLRRADIVLPADWDDHHVQRLAMALRIIHISKGRLKPDHTLRFGHNCYSISLP